ncbi:MAG: putative quinol monooxygenase [Alphaproteobacteria bacterium]
MDGFVVLARFDLRPGTGALFQRLVLDNARASVRDEPGCRRFDVLSPRDGADRATLYEIYDDAGAFAAHKATPHYAAFRDATKDLVEALVVEEYDLTENAAG